MEPAAGALTFFFFRYRSVNLKSQISLQITGYVNRLSNCIHDPEKSN